MTTQKIINILSLYDKFKSLDDETPLQIKKYKTFNVGDYSEMSDDLFTSAIVKKRTKCYVVFDFIMWGDDVVETQKLKIRSVAGLYEYALMRAPGDDFKYYFQIMAQ